MRKEELEETEQEADLQAHLSRPNHLKEHVDFNDDYVFEPTCSYCRKLLEDDIEARDRELTLVQQDDIEQIRSSDKHTDVYWFEGVEPFRILRWACSNSPMLPTPGASDA